MIQVQRGLSRSGRRSPVEGFLTDLTDRLLRCQHQGPTPCLMSHSLLLGLSTSGSKHAAANPMPDFSVLCRAAMYETNTPVVCLLTLGRVNNSGSRISRRNTAEICAKSDQTHHESWKQRTSALTFDRRRPLLSRAILHRASVDERVSGLSMSFFVMHLFLATHPESGRGALLYLIPSSPHASSDLLLSDGAGDAVACRGEWWRCCRPADIVDCW